MKAVVLALATVFMVLTAGLPVPAAAQAAPDVQQQQPADAKPFDQRKLLVPHRNADGTVEVVPFTDDPVLWARGQQQNFHMRMLQAMRDMGNGHGLSAGLALVVLSFIYGVLHAAGPGHGKAVISGWLLATETQLRRGIMVAFLSSIFQALTAIVVVSALLLLVAGAASAVKDAARWMEGASFALIAAVGAYLVWTGVKPLLPRLGIAGGAVPAAAGAAVTATYEGHHFEILTPHASPLPSGHVHGPDCGCGHAHAPEARDVAGDFSWRKAVALAFAIGLRPCTGALLVLVFSYTLGLYWAGVASTFAMAFGTFITIAVVASIAVYGKALAERLAGRRTQGLFWLGTGLRLVAGALIAAFGVVMTLAALQGPVSGG